MAKFLATLLNNSDVKQGLEKGPQGIAHAAVGLVEQFATRGLIGKVLPGVGMINPLLGIFTEPIVSAIKAQLNAQLLQPIFGGGPTQALNMVDATGASSDVTGIRQVVSNVQGFLPRFEYRSTGDDSFKRGTFADPYLGGFNLPDTRPTSAVGSPLDTRMASEKPFASENFSELRQVLGTNPMAMGTETHGIFLESSEAKVSNAESNGGSNIKATSGVFTSTKDAGNTVLGFVDRDTAADPTLPTGAIPVTSIIDSVFHASLKPQLPLDMTSRKFSAEDSASARSLGGTLASTSVDTTARNPKIDPDTGAAFAGGSRPGNHILNSGLNTKFTEVGGQGVGDLAGTVGLEGGDVVAVMGTASVRRHIIEDSAHNVLSEAFLQQHRFLVFDATGDSRSVFEWTDGEVVNTLAAGFSYCDAPSLSIRTEDVKEGTWEFPRQIPVGADPGRITMSKGIIRSTTGFYLWIEQFLRGNITRRTLKILAYGRNLEPDINDSTTGPWNRPEKKRAIYGEWTLYNCAPLRYSAGQGWDARTGEIQIADLEVGYEWFEESSPIDLIGEQQVPSVG